MNTFRLSYQPLLKCIVLILLVFEANAEVMNAPVIGISDGDKINFLDNSSKEHKVRLMDIKAPEKSQAFGKAIKLAAFRIMRQQFAKSINFHDSNFIESYWT